MDFNIQEIMDKAPELAITYGVKIVLAILVFYVGKWIARAIANGFEKAMSARQVDSTVARFTRNIVFYALLTVVIIAALGQLGVQTASFVAVVGAAGLAIGLALQGALANFAAGVLLILFRPFKAGDFIEAGGTSGIVKEISIFTTILATGDNKQVIVANNAVWSGNIVNYNAYPTRRVDLVVGVSYSADLALVKKTLFELAEADERVLKDPEVAVVVSELADSSVNFIFRAWVDAANWWPVKCDLTEKIKLRFDELGIEIPFPQMDVHVDKVAKEESVAI